MKWFKKKTKEEEIQHRVDDLFMKLTSDADFSFTELETVQIINDVRRKLHEFLSNKKSDFHSKSVEFQQKAKEIEMALEYFE